MQPEQLELTLKRPAKAGDVAYPTITLVEPTAGQLEDAGAGGRSGTSLNIALISLVAKIPVAAARDILKSDYDFAVSYLAGFTRDVPRTGGE